MALDQGKRSRRTRGVLWTLLAVVVVGGIGSALVVLNRETGSSVQRAEWIDMPPKSTSRLVFVRAVLTRNRNGEVVVVIPPCDAFLPSQGIAMAAPMANPPIAWAVEPDPKNAHLSLVDHFTIGQPVTGTRTTHALIPLSAANVMQLQATGVSRKGGLAFLDMVFTVGHVQRGRYLYEDQYGPKYVRRAAFQNACA